MFTCTYIFLPLCSPEVGPSHVAGYVKEHDALKPLWKLHWLSITLKLDPTLKVALRISKELFPTKSEVEHAVLCTTPGN